MATVEGGVDGGADGHRDGGGGRDGCFFQTLSYNTSMFVFEIRLSGFEMVWAIRLRNGTELGSSGLELGLSWGHQAQKWD